MVARRRVLSDRMGNDLLLAMHNLRAVLVRKGGERVQASRGD